MKETIATIPVNDLFAPKDGCPFCRMERMLEEQYCEFVTGDAMMEPLIRIETNKKGFCNRHFTRMTQVGQKLPNALILESHLQEIMEQYGIAESRISYDSKGSRVQPFAENDMNRVSICIAE